MTGFGEIRDNGRRKTLGVDSRLCIKIIGMLAAKIETYMTFNIINF